MYKRVLLKVSGEQLAGQLAGGIDPEVGTWLAQEVKKVTDAGTQVLVVVGAGNFVRGAELAGHGISRVTADQIGMLGTMMNALALTDIFESQGVPATCLSSIFAEQVAEPLIPRTAEKYLAMSHVVLAAGGMGRTYVTTDTAAVSLALEFGCEVVLKATKVDGVYDKDPVQFPDAQKIPQLSFQEAVSDGAIQVMDKAALAMAMDHQLPIIVFDAMQPDNIAHAAAGQPTGTTIR